MIYGVNYDFYKREYKQWFMELIMTFIKRVQTMIYGVNYDFYKREYKQWFMELILTFIKESTNNDLWS